MIKFIDMTGKTEDEAIRRALEQLGLERDDVSVEILERAKSGFLGIGETIDVSTSEGRIEYLSSLGWCVDKSSETEAEVTLPKTFDGAVADYAAMQSEQGFEFTSYGGCKCMQYSYIVTNYGDGSTVYAILFVKGGRVIGGDIHSADIGGFMHGIK